MVGGGVVWDMCSGWGSRLIAALTSEKVTKYIGSEPFSKTFEGLQQIVSDFEDMHDKEVTLLKKGSETVKLDRESVDICFTSPPYFDLEKYSDEPSQSTVKYADAGQWREKFLGKTISNCFDALKPGGRLILNVKNTKAYGTLVEDTKSLAEKAGFTFVEELKLCLSTMQKGKKFKFEPVLVFVK